MQAMKHVSMQNARKGYKLRCNAIKIKGDKMNKHELKRLSRADLLEMLIIKCRENDQLRAELEQAKLTAVPASDEQIATVLRAVKTAVDRYLDGAGEGTK